LTQQACQAGLQPQAVADHNRAMIEQARTTLEQVDKYLDATPARLDSKQIYSAIFDKSPFALTLTRMPEGTLVDVNNAFLELFGFNRDDVIGKTSPELAITDAESRSQVAALLAKDGFVKEFDCTRRTKSGSEVFLSLSLDWVVISGEKFILTTIRDITAEKVADQACIESLSIAQQERKRLSAMMEALPIGVAIVDEKGGNIQANRAFEELWGSPRPPADGVSDYQAYQAWWVDSGLPVMPEEWASAQAVQHAKTVIGQVMKIKKFDGTLAFVHNSAAPITDQYGKVIGCAVAIQDITSLKSHEDEIYQLNRTLKALSSSNQAMLRAANEQDYLNEVCRIIIEDCGFKLAWIGYAENDKKKSVRPVASAGFDQGYLDQLNITWADTERGRGPTGIAIRTQKPCRCNNMLTDPKFAPWREAAIQRGYASSLVIPLISSGHTIGALNIYSRQPEGFPDEQVDLITELAGDLAYGITTLRMKADHALAEEALQQSEERYRTIVETASEGIVMASPKGKFTYVNKRMSEMLGYPVEEILGKSAMDFAYSDLEPLASQSRKKLADGESLHGEFKFRRKDGSPLWSLYNASPIYNDKGEHIANLAMHTDITERKRMEEHLAYLATFPERNPRPIIEVDHFGNVSYANPTALRSFPELIEQKLAHPFLADWDSVISSLGQEPDGIVTRDIAVGDRYYEQSINILPGQDFVRIYGLDVTERKLANQALLEAHEELEQRVLRRTEELNTANEQLRAEVAERESTQIVLESTVQELQLVEEELRKNNDMLVDAQKVLKTERQRYQDLFDFAPDGYLVTDSDGLILESNQNAILLLDVPHRQLEKKPLIGFIHRDDHLIFNHILEILSSQGGAQSNELRLTPRHDKVLTTAITVASAKDRDGKSVLRWTIRDITESKRAEEIIRQNSLRNEVLSELSESLAEASLDELAILDIVTRTTAMRVGDSCVINLVSDDGQWLDPVAWHHTQPEVLKIMDSIFETSHHPANEGLSGRVFGSSQPALISMFNLENLEVIPSEIRLYIERIGIASVLIVPLQIGTKVIGTISMIRNRCGQPYTIDDQALLEIIAYRAAQMIHIARLYRELQEAMRKEIQTHDQLVQAEKFAAVGRLLASITHEINNPLQTIKNCLYLSQIDTQPGTPVYDSLAMAVTETNRLSNLVAQLREIYRPPTTGLNKPINIPVLLSEVQTLLGSYLQENHVTWELLPESANRFDHLIIEGVADQLKQVFLNISLNAIDAMEPGGGKITIDLKVSDDNNQAGISIRDTGPGLTQEVKDKLFEPFITTKEKGLGLGLVICYDIIQKHNGRIDVDSEPGKGAAFTIWLPARIGKEQGEK
jgi:PAS domain S-box-containing protein